MHESESMAYETYETYDSEPGFRTLRARTIPASQSCDFQTPPPRATEPRRIARIQAVASEKALVSAPLAPRRTESAPERGH